MKKLTLFSAPKPFSNSHIDLIQRNAILSWKKLGAGVEVLLIGEEEGLADVANEYEVTHLPDVKRNSWGTPRVDSIFQMARDHSESELLAYTNADIILFPKFVRVVRMISEVSEQFLVVGRRWDYGVEQKIIFEEGWDEELLSKVKETGSLHGPTAMDYFVFPRGLFTDIPAFAIGRAGWDNWMIYHAQENGWMVIDVSPTLPVVHQSHDYHHLPQGKPHHNLEESKRNVELGGGFTKVYDLLDVDWIFVEGEIKKAPWDLPRLLRKMEHWIMPKMRKGWRWRLTHLIRRLRKSIT